MIRDCFYKSDGLIRFFHEFVLNGQERIREIISMDEIHSEDEDNEMGTML